MPPSIRRTCIRSSRVLMLALFCAALCTPYLTTAQVNKQGRWQTLSQQMPINPVHVALLRTGKVLIVSGSGNVPTNSNWQAAIFDPATGATTTQALTWDMFCNGMVVLPEIGRASCRE